MKEKIESILRINFVKDVATMETGKFFFVLLGIASSVIFARILHLEKYGMYGLIFAFTGIIGIFMNWGSNYATITVLSGAYAKKDKAEIRNILSYFVGLNLFKICTIGVLIYIIAPLLTDIFYHNIEIGYWARIVLLANFIDVVYSMFNIVLQTSRRIKKLTLVEVYKKFVASFLPSALVVFGLGLFGLVLGYFLTAFIFLLISFLIYSIYAPRDALLPSFKEIFNNISFKIIKKYFKFGFLIAIHKNIGELMGNVPVFFLGMFTGLSDVSYFKIALAYATMPNMFLEPISRMLSVQLPKSKEMGPKFFKEHFFKTAIYAGLITAFVCFIFIVLAPHLIKLFYGAEYAGAISLVYYLIILTIISGFAVGLGSFYRTINRMKIPIVIDACQGVLVILLILFLNKITTPLMAVIYSIVFSSVLSSASHFFIVRKLFKNNYGEKQFKTN